MKKSKIEWFAKLFLGVFLSAWGYYLIDDAYIFVGVSLMIWSNNVMGDYGE